MRPFRALAPWQTGQHDARYGRERARLVLMTPTVPSEDTVELMEGTP
jgi:hypothetical protein